VCLQESKLCNVNEKILKEIVGARLDARACILANGSAGGVILAWKSSLFYELNRQTQSCVVKWI
jgi:hypothetical protein